MKEDKGYRGWLAGAAIAGGLGGLAGLYFVAVPEGNREPLLLALGLVLGWGSTVIGYEFGSSPAGRAAANAAIDQVTNTPTGTPADPLSVQGAGTNAAPVNTKDAGDVQA